MKHVSNLVVMALAVTLLLVAGTAAVLAGTDGVTACAQNGNGYLRLLDDGDTCGDKEVEITIPDGAVQGTTDEVGEVLSVVRFAFTADGCATDEYRIEVITVSGAALDWIEDGCTAPDIFRWGPTAPEVFDLSLKASVAPSSYAALDGAWLEWEPVGGWTVIDGQPWQLNCLPRDSNPPFTQEGPLVMGCMLVTRDHTQATLDAAGQLTSRPLIIRAAAGEA